jgi:uncharacterized RDD family membrane protein YckC
MSTIPVNTSQNIMLDFELGSLGDRILGRLIDLAVVIAYVLIIIILISGFAMKGGPGASLLFILAALPIVFYDLVLEVFFNGQSIGKRAMNTRVVSMDGNRPTLGQFMIRWLFRLVDFTLTQSLCAVICVAVSKKHQRLGDMVAGTAVIKIRALASLQETLYVPVQEDYEVRFPEAAALKDADIQLIKEVLQHYNHSDNLLLLHNTAEKIRDTLHIQDHMDPSMFLHTIISDYNYLGSRG